MSLVFNARIPVAAEYLAGTMLPRPQSFKMTVIYKRKKNEFNWLEQYCPLDSNAIVEMFTGSVKIV